MISSGRSRPAGRPNDAIPRFDHKFIASTMSSKKIAKTNAARLLERLEIPFTLHQADVDESDLSAVTMARAAATRCFWPPDIW